MFVILVAMDKEAQYINCPNAKIIITGIGVNNVVKTLSKALINKEISEKDTFINVGYAGSSCFNMGDIVKVTAVKRLYPSHTVNEETYPLIIAEHNIENVAPCYTTDDFYEGDKSIPLVDMELYYMRAFFKNIMAFKIVSDNLNSKSYEEFNPIDAWERMNNILNKITNE